MRQIISRNEEAKRKKKNQFIVGGILVFLMLSSILGYSFQSKVTGAVVEEGKKIAYDGLEFTEQSGFWLLNLKGVNLIFRYNPSQVEQNSLYLNKLDFYLEKPLYIYSENPLAESEVRNNLGSFVGAIQNACPIEGKCEENIPVKDCTENFIIIKEGENVGITQEQNCVFISGRGSFAIN